MRRTLIPVFALALMLNAAVMDRTYSQDNTFQGKVGLSASLQASQVDILLPIWVTNRFSIAPAFGMVWADGGGSDVHLAIVPRFYFHKEKVAPYLGLKAGALIASPSKGESTTDWITGLAIGGEYFLDDYFSFGVESQLNVTISSEKSTRFGNPGKANANTAAAVFATVYF